MFCETHDDVTNYAFLTAYCIVLHCIVLYRIAAHETSVKATRAQRRELVCIP